MSMTPFTLDQATDSQPTSGLSSTLPIVLKKVHPHGCKKQEKTREREEEMKREITFSTHPFLSPYLPHKLIKFFFSSEIKFPHREPLLELFFRLFSRGSVQENPFTSLPENPPSVPISNSPFSFSQTHDPGGNLTFTDVKKRKTKSKNPEGRNGCFYTRT